MLVDASGNDMNIIGVIMLPVEIIGYSGDSTLSSESCEASINARLNQEEEIYTPSQSQELQNSTSQNALLSYQGRNKDLPPPSFLPPNRIRYSTDDDITNEESGVKCTKTPN